MTASQTSSFSAEVSFCREIGDHSYLLYFKSGFYSFPSPDLSQIFWGGNVNVLLVGILQRNRTIRVYIYMYACGGCPSPESAGMAVGLEIQGRVDAA